MTPARFRAFIAENWPNLTVGGEWGHLVLCGDVTVAFAHFDESDKLTGIIPYPMKPNDWRRGRAATVAAINSALDALIVRHEAVVEQLKAAKEGRP